MPPFNHWFAQQQVVFGRGTAANLGEQMARLGLARPLVVCSPRARADAACRAIGAEPASAVISIWDGVRAHAPLRAALEGARAARAHGADAIVSFGGGSASDLAKGIALVLAEGDDIEQFALRREPDAPAARASTAPKLPLIAVPTTLSGAEVTPGFSLTRDGAYKLLFRDPALAARLVVLDPQLIVAAPDRMLTGSGMNALAHCCEALYSKARTPISSLFATEGLRLLWTGLERRLGGDDSADDLVLGAYLAGVAIVNARTALHHAICHKLAPLAGMSHGEANTLVLPHVLAFNLPLCPEEAVRMADAMGVDAAGEASALVTGIAARLTDLARRAGLETRLRATSLDRSLLDELALRVYAEPGLAFNPRPIENPARIREILERAW